MLRKLLVVGLTLGFTGTIVVAESASNLSAADIVNKNVAARGGLKAWHAVQTISESGKMGAGGNDRAPVAAASDVKRPGKPVAPLPASPRLKEEAQLPFRLDLGRPRKMRLELDFNGQTAVQVYDGSNGWKVRPFLNRMEVESYTQDELRLAALQSDLDGPLVDYAAKGTKVELEGTEKVEDRDTYRLKLTMKDGHATHVWIDAKTFLEAKIEGAPRRLDGQEHTVEIYFRDYRAVDGLQIPFLLETRVVPLATPAKGNRAASKYPPEKIVIEKVQVNPKFEAALFTRPVIETTASAKPR
jgi:outer membrane lipoprotein-sorting protein